MLSTNQLAQLLPRSKAYISGNYSYICTKEGHDGACAALLAPVGGYE